jgi:hypothetical protein
MRGAVPGGKAPPRTRRLWPPLPGHPRRRPAWCPSRPPGWKQVVTGSHRQTAGQHRTGSALRGAESPFFLGHGRVPLGIHRTRSFPAVVELLPATTYGSTGRHRTAALLTPRCGQERCRPGRSRIAEWRRVWGSERRPELLLPLLGLGWPARARSSQQIRDLSGRSAGDYQADRCPSYRTDRDNIR